jgi:hypothetical protein
MVHVKKNQLRAVEKLYYNFSNNQGKHLCKPSDQHRFGSSKFSKLLTFPNYISVRCGVSKRVNDGRRPPALLASKRLRKRRLTCKSAVRLFQE